MDDIDSSRIKEFYSKLKNFRQELHANPELSGKEDKTQKRILDFLKDTNPDKIIKDIGGYGLAYIFDSGKKGPSVLFRGDIDALPINEYNSRINYISKNKGVAHLCGHDGHTTVLSGLAKLIDLNPPKIGKTILLFQPAEETGQGAEAVIKDEKFKEINPDYAFAFHNLPGYKRHNLIIKEGAFASASTGVIIGLKGLSSHAAYHEDGNNPDLCLAELIQKFNKIKIENIFDDFVLLTVIHTKLGEQAFGTSPGEAVIMLTIRAYQNEDIDRLKNQVNEVTKQCCDKYGIKHNLKYTEEFPASINDKACVEIVHQAANESNINAIQIDAAFRWSEDFGHFTINNKSAIFGIGSGEDHPQLHNEDFNFPDEIIETAINIFYKIYKKFQAYDE